MARLGCLTTSFPTSPDDPAGLFVADLARALAELGHEIDVVAPAPPGPLRPLPLPPAVTVRFVEYARPRERQRVFHLAGAPDNLVRDPGLWRLVPAACGALAREVARSSRRWDGLIAHWLLPSALLASARRPGTPVLCVAHSSDVHLLARLPGRRSWARAILAASDRVGFVSETLRARFVGLLGDELAARSGARLLVTPLGLDRAALAAPAPREELRRALGLDDGFTLVSLGRLAPVKGLDTLLAALASRPRPRLLVAGDGPEAAALQGLARELGVRVRFLGAVPPSRRAALLHAGDAFVLPSRRLADGREEGLPLALLEAAAAGLPAIATATGAVEEIVSRHPFALVVPPDDPPALGAAIDRLAASPALRGALATAGRALAADRDWRLLAPRFAALALGDRDQEASAGRSS